MQRITFTAALASLLLPVLSFDDAVAENLSSKWTINQYTKSRLFVGGYDKEKKILHLGWQLSLKKGWKTYWRTPGDAGLPPRWIWNDTSNVNTIAVNWPRPELIHIFGMDTYIYSQEVILPIEVTIADGAKAVSITLDLQYLICAEVCIPQEGSYSLDVSSFEDIKISLFQKAQLDLYRERVPVKIPATNIIAKSDMDQANILAIQLPESFAQIETVIVEGPEGILFGRSVAKGNSRFDIPHNRRKSLTGQQLTLTLLQKDGGASETRVTVQP